MVFSFTSIDDLKRKIQKYNLSPGVRYQAFGNWKGGSIISFIPKRAGEEVEVEFRISNFGYGATLSDQNCFGFSNGLECSDEKCFCDGECSCEDGDCDCDGNEGCSDDYQG